MKSEKTKGARLGVLARCAWRVNWLGVAFNKQKDMGWIGLSWAAVLIFSCLGVIFLGASRSGDGAGWVMSFVSAYWWSSPSREGWGELWSASLGVQALAVAGVVLRLARLIQALWRPLPTEAGAFAAQHPIMAWTLSPVLLGWAMNERGAIRAMDWARAEGEKRRSAPEQAIVGVLTWGAVLALVFESTLMLMGLVLSMMLGVFWAVAAIRGNSIFTEMAMTQPGMALALGVIVAILARQAIGLGALGWIKRALAKKRGGLLGFLPRASSSGALGAQSKSAWAEAGERWSQAMLRHAERDGALSEAERELLLGQTARAKKEARGETKRL